MMNTLRIDILHFYLKLNLSREPDNTTDHRRQISPELILVINKVERAFQQRDNFSPYGGSPMTCPFLNNPSEKLTTLK